MRTGQFTIGNSRRIVRYFDPSLGRKYGHAELTPRAITQLLKRAQTGDRYAAGRLITLLYDQLHMIAAACMRAEDPAHILQPTALINEAFIRIFGRRAGQISNRSHFFAVAAGVMRHVLVDYARKFRTEKRGGRSPALPLDEELVFSEPQSALVLGVDEALDRLSKLSTRQAQIAELRFFAGLSVIEIAEALDVAPRTVVREWSVAKRWLRRELSA